MLLSRQIWLQIERANSLCSLMPQNCRMLWIFLKIIHVIRFEKIPTLVPSKRVLRASYLLACCSVLRSTSALKQERKVLIFSGCILECEVILFFMWSSLFLDPFSLIFFPTSAQLLIYTSQSVYAFAKIFCATSPQSLQSLSLISQKRTRMNSAYMWKSGQTAFLKRSMQSRMSLMSSFSFSRLSMARWHSSRQLQDSMRLKSRRMRTISHSRQVLGSRACCCFHSKIWSIVPQSCRILLRMHRTLSLQYSMVLSTSSMQKQELPMFSSSAPASQSIFFKNFSASQQERILSMKWPVKQLGWLYLLSLLITLTLSYTSCTSFVPSQAGISIFRSSSTMKPQQLESWISSSSRLFMMVFMMAMVKIETTAMSPMMRPIVRFIWLLNCDELARDVEVQVFLLPRYSRQLWSIWSSSMISGPRIVVELPLTVMVSSTLDSTGSTCAMTLLGTADLVMGKPPLSLILMARTQRVSLGVMRGMTMEQLIMKQLLQAKLAISNSSWASLARSKCRVLTPQGPSPSAKMVLSERIAFSPSSLNSRLAVIYFLSARQLQMSHWSNSEKAGPSIRLNASSYREGY